MKIVWAEPKRLSNLDKHGLDFADLTLEFFVGAKIEPTKSDRFKALSLNDGQAIAVIFSPRGKEGVSVVSMRRASRNERRLLR
jgi:uncharacterized protein